MKYKVVWLNDPPQIERVKIGMTVAAIVKTILNHKAANKMVDMLKLDTLEMLKSMACARGVYDLWTNADAEAKKKGARLKNDKHAEQQPMNAVTDDETVKEVERRPGLIARLAAAPYIYEGYIGESIENGKPAGYCNEHGALTYALCRRWMPDGTHVTYVKALESGHWFTVVGLSLNERAEGLGLNEKDKKKVVWRVNDIREALDSRGDNVIVVDPWTDPPIVERWTEYSSGGMIHDINKGRKKKKIVRDKIVPLRWTRAKKIQGKYETPSLEQYVRSGEDHRKAYLIEVLRSDKEPGVSDKIKQVVDARFVELCEMYKSKYKVNDIKASKGLLTVGTGRNRDFLKYVAGKKREKGGKKSKYSVWDEEATKVNEVTWYAWETRQSPPQGNSGNRRRQ